MSEVDFRVLFPNAPGDIDEIEDAVDNACVEFGIISPAQQAMFLSQCCGHESNGLTRLEENFGYSPARIRSLFPFKFKSYADAKKVVEGGPEAIANRIYGGRIGNGPEITGDGYRFRGRGIIMLTGRANYGTYDKRLRVNLLSDPDLASKFPVAARVAACFWKTTGCNELAELGDIEGTTLRINGGLIGIKDRIARWQTFCSYFGVFPVQTKYV